jgi:hypothetical protein
VVERLNRFSPRPRVENEVSSLALVLDLDPELLLETAVTPKQVDDNSAGLPVPEVISCG